MLRSISVLAALLLAGCTLGGGDLVKVGPDPKPGVGTRFLIHVSGAVDLQGLSGIIGVDGKEIALTSYIKCQGKGTITIRPASVPIVTIDGDTTFIVEPTPGLEADAQASLARGELLILRDGKPGLLNAPGTMAAVNAMPVPPGAITAPTVVPSSSPPPPPPPPEPFSAPGSGKSCGGSGKACGGGSTSSTTETPPVGPPK